MCAWAADNAAVAPRAIANRKSTIADGVDAITIPYLTSYQGKLTDTAGRAVRDSSYAVTFRLYTQPTGGSAYWNETQTVTTRSGLFSVLLGSVEPVYYPDEGNCYLSMQVGATPELAPRMQIGSAAYAFCAWRADTAYRAGSAPAARPITPGVANAEIAANAVTSDKVQDHSIKGVDLAAPCSLVTQVGNPNAALMIRALNTGNGIRIDTADNVGIIIHGTRNDGLTIYNAHSNGIYAYHVATYGVRGAATVAGGYFEAESARGIGMVAKAYNSVATDTAVRAYGKGLASGGWSTGFDDGGEAPCIVSAERTIIASGSARLSAGRAEISLPEIFTKHTRPDVPVRLSVTPTADAPGLLVAERRGNAGFSVRLRRIAGFDGTDDAAFDWIAVGVLEEPSSEPVPDRER
jgi:hypothetical protein